MCVSAPSVKTPAQPPIAASNSATDLYLGSQDILQRSGGIFGRLALSGGRLQGRSSSSGADSQGALASGNPTGGSSSAQPGGTLGLPSDWTGKGQFGGLGGTA